jgi:hypothetical protein
MSLNTLGKGVAIAKLGKEMIYVSEQPLEDGVRVMPAKNGDHFQQYPNKKSERDVVFITAPSGAGKSWWCRDYLKVYNKMYPKNKVYLFSSLEHDDTLDPLTFIKRIKIKSPQFLTLDLKVEDFKDTCVLFDDCDCIRDKAVLKQVYSIMNMVLETGRHENVTCLVTSHAATAGLQTKCILREAKSCVIFPKTAGARGLKYLLEGYFGLSKEEIERVKRAPGRWVSIFRTFPVVCMSQNEVFQLRD